MAIVAISRLHKIAFLSMGAVRSLRHCHIDKSVNKYVDVQPWTRNYVPTVKWDYNWDRRDPKSIVKPPDPGKPGDEKRYKEEIEKETAKAVHHLFFIRTGQYDPKEPNSLTELGKQQAELTGKRLASLEIAWAPNIVSSNLKRALETLAILQKQLPIPTEGFKCQIIGEGTPISPEPPSANMVSDIDSFRDNPRLEAAFRNHFRRAPPSLETDYYSIIVCHSNAIRFFVCRALQFPPEGWGRMNLNHGSITWLSLQPNGEVILRAMNDTGHMEPKYITC